MISEHSEQALGVARTEHEEAIEAFGTDGPHEAFRDPVRLWRLDRRASSRHSVRQGTIDRQSVTGLRRRLAML